MSNTQDNIVKERRQRQQQSIKTVSQAESIIASQVFDKRRTEIYEYLKLFGYKPDKTIIQVHITGFFRKKNQSSQKQRERYRAAVKKYGGTSFVIVGRTHDPSITESVVKPKKKNPLDSSPGYVGYLWKNKDPQKREPHQIIPLDFTPIHLPYPQDWKNLFATKGFMLALHVPASFAKDKNRLTRALYRISKNGVIDIKSEWTFLNEIRQFGIDNTISNNNYNNKHQITRISTVGTSSSITSNSSDYAFNNKAKKTDNNNDPLRIIKIRLAKGEISKEEYEELRNAIAS
jgi:Short C-terminal domain